MLAPTTHSEPNKHCRAPPFKEKFNYFSSFSCKVASVVSDSLQPSGSCTPQAPLSLGFSRQEHWSGLPCPLVLHR